MPRITPIRLLKALVLPWLVLTGLWLFLPSPIISTTFRQHHIETVLQSGKTLTTVHPTSHFFSESQWIPDDCSGLIIDWHLVSQPKHDSVSLQINDNVKINLTAPLLRAQLTSNDAFRPYLSDLISIRSKLGDEDHIINMPWFHWPDQVLFHNQMHGFDIDLDLRIYVPQPGVVEVWKEMPILQSLGTVEVREADRAYGLLVTFSNLETFKSARSSITRIRVSNVKGELLSRTYTIRSWIIGPLAPFILVVGAAVFFTVGPMVVCFLPVAVVYGLLVTLMWLLRGRPDLGQWLGTYWMTRWLFRGWKRRRERKAQIWGPGGPMYVSDDSETEVERTGLLGKTVNGSVAGRFNTSAFGTSKSVVRMGKRSRHVDEGFQSRD